MFNLNEVKLIGNLGADPELKTTTTEKSVATLSIATRGFARKGEPAPTEWHRVIAWGQSAEYAAKYLKKGAQVYVTGSLKTRKWQDKDGNTQYTTEIHASEVQGNDRRPDRDGENADGSEQG